MTKTKQHQTKPKNAPVVVEHGRLPKAYLIISVVILMLTTALWAYWGARVHATNADQLVNSQLFESKETFSKSLLPGQHSFLIKWPLIFLVRAFGLTDNAFLVVTILTTLLTVGLFAFLLYRIDKRPFVFGTICLGLASVLLLVPAAPYAGGILPVNMAMLTTRNIEYIVYILALVVLIKNQKLRSAGFWASVSLMSLLIATDKLFLTVNLGASIAGLVGYALLQRWKMVVFSASWVANTLISSVIATGLLSIINKLQITNIESSINSPYQFISSLHSLGLAIIFGFFGVVTNFGANPFFDISVFRNIPSVLIDRLTSLSGLGFIVNALIFSSGSLVVLKTIKDSIGLTVKSRFKKSDTPAKLSIALILSCLSATVGFVASDHYYVVDARYLAIFLFAVFVSITTYVRNKEFDSKKLVGVGSALVFVMIFSTFGSIDIGKAQIAALDNVKSRNQNIANNLKSRNSPLLVGDYWRVIPTKQESNNKLQVTPLSDCTTPRDVLSSKAWQPDLKDKSFAYLLSFDKSLTNFPECSLKEVTKTYGNPNKSSVVEGTIEKPKELLLFYESGTNGALPASLGNTTGTILPVDFKDLPNQICAKPTVMQIIAHQDDDLLFMNPDLQTSIRAGHCIRTVYLTAGDGGNGQDYWLGREKGAEEAYSHMLGSDTIWEEKLVKLNTGQVITIASPQGNSKIQLIFIHLPDGNLRGQGFGSNNFQSLDKLDRGLISSINTVDKQFSYTNDNLVSALSDLMTLYRPTLFRTQSSIEGTSTRPDHSDHNTTSRIATKAYDKFEATVLENQLIIPLDYYSGYAIYDKPANVYGEELSNKQNIFFKYTNHDPAACSTNQSCWSTSNYSNYVERQYRADR